MILWLTIIGVGLFTFATRLSFIAMRDEAGMPPMLRRALRFVPAAALSAIIFPELVRHGGALDLSLANNRLIAGVIAAAVAYRTRNVFLTIGVGMLTLWLLQGLSPLAFRLWPDACILAGLRHSSLLMPDI